MSFVWIDGKLVDKYDARVSIFDHGFLYGDGVWEALRVHDGRPFRLGEHLDELQRSASALHLCIPLDADGLATAVAQTLQANNRREGYVRIICTRGAGTLGLDPRKCEPTVIVIAEEIGLFPRELYDSGLDVISLPFPRPFPPATVLGRTGFTAAKATALRAGCLESLLFDPDDRLLGATEATAFVIREGTLLPSADAPGGPEAVMRRAVIEFATMPVADRAASRGDVVSAEEVFLAGAAGGLIAVARIDGKPVGSGAEGPLTRRLRHQYLLALGYTEGR